MYKKQNRDKQKDIRVVSLEDLVPRDHLLRKIDRAINFDFIYEEVKDLYSATEWGKPEIKPVQTRKRIGKWKLKPRQKPIRNSWMRKSEKTAKHMGKGR